MNAFRLSRHHLSEGAVPAPATKVSGEMGGAQAQVLSAAQVSIWARTKVTSIGVLNDAIWKDRSLVRAWCMRRTLFLVPSDELALFVGGTAQGPEYNLRWARARVSSGRLLEKALFDIARLLDRPRSRSEIALLLRAEGYKLKLKAGGGWGDSRQVPWAEVGGRLFSLGFLIRTVGAREAICSGPNVGSESTYVRAGRWVRSFRDTPREKAEDELLTKYLRAYGPSTLADFALWIGLYVRDARTIWNRAAKGMIHVEVDGWKAEALEADASDLEKAEMKRSTVRLLPNFDAFLLGHRSHRNIVDETHHKKVFRGQGWVSPVLLVNGRAAGAWSYRLQKGEFEVRVDPFTELTADLKSEVREEASELGRFLGSKGVRSSFV